MRTKFSETLIQVREAKGLKQYQFAKVLGCEPSYLSALERGNKEPPKSEKLNLMIEKMEITEEIALTLREAAEFQLSTIKVPHNTDEAVREMCVVLSKRLPTISRSYAKIITQLLLIAEESKM
ncbi:MAG: helix-turn-helix transcriptional regulator [Methylophilus sp.]|uniref:helix-turn-helix transcriptional regulator n=1 Tax=Methylophilus sp. TaxID=29541 RepID=UPI004035C634